MSEVVYREENYEVVKSGRTFEVVRTTAGVKTIIQSGESLEDAKLTIANDRKWTEQ